MSNVLFRKVMRITWVILGLGNYGAGFSVLVWYTIAYTSAS
jgi:hypothetical protein